VEVNVLEAVAFGELHHVLDLRPGRMVHRACQPRQPSPERGRLVVSQLVERPGVATQHHHEPGDDRNRMAMLDTPVLVQVKAGSVGQNNLTIQRPA